MNAPPLCSIIMPSFLGPYPSAAEDRNTKILRAINSVINQSFTNWELIIIADGCPETFDIVSNNYSTNEKIKCSLIAKQPLWSGSPRNFGIDKAKGEYIIYLDIDDYFGVFHLSRIKEGLEEKNFPQWVWFNDFEWSKHGSFYEMDRDIHKKFHHGTSNVCHRRSLEVFWDDKGTYEHDHVFIKKLKAFTNVYKIATPQYYICHVPNKFDI